MKSSKPKVLVAMSGGVDSSVAAALLLEKGYNVSGVFMKFWSEEAQTTQKNTNFSENKCCSLESYRDALRVASKLGIRLYTWNMKTNFKKYVVNDFLAQYQKGRTPNPCIQCNKYIKFGEFLSRAKKLGFDYLATGHYVRLKHSSIQALKLQAARDKNKDQSYFLWTLTQSQLQCCLFPIGDYTKTEVRKIAQNKHLPVYKKAESQGLCFIRGKRHYDFLRRHLRLKPGPIVTQDGVKEKGLKPGAVIGTHQGLPLYTIGQRREILVSGIGPFYVVKCNYRTNTLYVVTKFDRRLLFSQKLTANQVNWIKGASPKMPFKCKVKIRYGHPAVPAGIKKSKNHLPAVLAPARQAGEIKKSRILVEFSQPQRAITPGQSVVFYHGNEMLGGGVIS